MDDIHVVAVGPTLGHSSISRAEVARARAAARAALSWSVADQRVWSGTRVDEPNRSRPSSPSRCRCIDGPRAGNVGAMRTMWAPAHRTIARPGEYIVVASIAQRDEYATEQDGGSQLEADQNGAFHGGSPSAAVRIGIKRCETRCPKTPT